MKKIIFAILCITILLLTFIGCNRSTQISYDAYEELVRSLKNMGYIIEAEDVEESILLGQRKWLTIDGNENISVYLYESNDEMEKDASYLSDDGFSYNNGKNAMEIEWVSYPHFYKSENMIILYVGENLEIVQGLEELVGSQFAGKIE
jgi:hypothetical protein